MTRPAHADLEAFLARLYVDADARASFLADPRALAEQAGLCPQDVLAVISIDRTGLELAAHSFAHKRSVSARRVTGPFRRLRAWLIGRATPDVS